MIIEHDHRVEPYSVYILYKRLHLHDQRAQSALRKQLQEDFERHCMPGDSNRLVGHKDADQDIAIAKKHIAGESQGSRSSTDMNSCPEASDYGMLILNLCTLSITLFLWSILGASVIDINESRVFVHGQWHTAWRALHDEVF
jgi:hypothetical protein